MTSAQASAILPEVVVVNRSDDAETAAMDALLDAAESLSPVVENGCAGVVFVDLAGLSGLYGSEQELAAEAIRRIRSIGLEASIGIGSSKEIARIAADCGGIRVIEAYREGEFLNWIPIDLLNPEPDLAVRLARWGIRRLGELSRLNIAEVGNRLGQTGVMLARLARGEANSQIVARRQAELFSEKIELEYGIELLEPLMFVMRGMLERLGARLALRGFIAGDLMLSFELVDQTRPERRVAIAAATNEIRPLLALLSASLEKDPPSNAINAIQITAEARSPRPAQSDLFLPPAPAPEKLQATMARLAALCGPGHVGELRAHDCYRPEAIEVVSFEPPAPCPAAKTNGSKANGWTKIVVRALRPAEEVEVLCNRGEPEFVRGGNICARVVSIAGPWRTQGEWWSETNFARDYYDLALADGGVYRMFHDLNNSRWFVDGIYD